MSDASDYINTGSAQSRSASERTRMVAGGSIGVLAE
jgi:hypothetical protein